MKIIEKSKKYPTRLLNIKNNPKVLYMQGNLKLLEKKAIAIVGSRDCTEYGYNYAKKISEELSKNNICIVSGLAKRNRYSSSFRSFKRNRRNYSSFRRGI